MAGKGDLWEQGAGKKGWPGRFWPEERPVDGGRACVGWGRGALPGLALGSGWAERLGMAVDPMLILPWTHWKPAASRKPKLCGPSPLPNHQKQGHTFTALRRVHSRKNETIWICFLGLKKRKAIVALVSRPLDSITPGPSTRAGPSRPLRSYEVRDVERGVSNNVFIHLGWIPC